MSRSMRGFSLIELMITMGIIAILAVIFLPSLSGHRIRSANTACVTELGAYKVEALAALHDGVTLPAPTSARCANVSTAAIGTLGAPGVITATALAPGDASVTCSIAPSVSCSHSSPSGN